MKKILVLSPLLLIVILLSGCGIKKVDDNKEATGLITKNIPIEKPKNQENIQPTVLKSYTNSKMNISLKYPEDVILSEPVSDVVLFNLINKKEYLQIQVLETTPPSPGDKYMPNGAHLIESVSIDSRVAKKYFTTTPVGEGVLEGGYQFTDYLIVINDKKWIQIEYYGSGEPKEIFENIIKSIKFN